MVAKPTERLVQRHVNSCYRQEYLCHVVRKPKKELYQPLIASVFFGEGFPPVEAQSF